MAAMTIAIANQKGGVGKTTLATMVIKYLTQTQPDAILASNEIMLGGRGGPERRLDGIGAGVANGTG